MRSSSKFSLDDEGVTRYRLYFQKSRPLLRSLISEINAWRSVLHMLGWIGQDPRRYGGVGFGNLSRRLPPKEGLFAVSGTQTGRHRRLNNKHYAIVTACLPRENRVWAKGPLAPSSESMTHAVVYKLDPTAQVVIHVHAPELWEKSRRLGLPQTSRQVAYGTPEMVEEVERLFRTRTLRKEKIFSMGGHRDGIVSFGRTADEAGERLIAFGLNTYKL